MPDAEIEKFKQEVQRQGLKVNAAHLPYTVNLGSVDERLQQFARLVLKEDLKRAAAVGTPLVVAHPGHYGEAGLERSLEQVAAVLKTSLKDAPAGPCLCLETMAGQGREIGGRLEELAYIIDLVGPEVKVGICLDSAHLFAAGWDMGSREGLDELVAAIRASFGWERVKMMHLNDSKTARGSRRDRHERIGQGEIGLAGIRAIVNHPLLGRLPLFLESPVDDYKQYQQEAQLVREQVRGNKNENSAPNRGL